MFTRRITRAAQVPVPQVLVLLVVAAAHSFVSNEANAWRRTDSQSSVTSCWGASLYVSVTDVDLDSSGPQRAVGGLG